MTDYRQRAFMEYDDLGSRTERLRNFITTADFDSLPEIERVDLKLQYEFMKGYHSVLSRRVSRMCDSA